MRSVIPQSPYLPVTQRKRKPSSCRIGMLSFLISSSVSVPYGSSMWMSHGGSAITTANFPRMDTSRKRMSQQIHWKGDKVRRHMSCYTSQNKNANHSFNIIIVFEYVDKYKNSDSKCENERRLLWKQLKDINTSSASFTSCTQLTTIFDV